MSTPPSRVSDSYTKTIKLNPWKRAEQGVLQGVKPPFAGHKRGFYAHFFVPETKISNVKAMNKSTILFVFTYFDSKCTDTSIFVWRIEIKTVPLHHLHHREGVR